MSSSDPTYSRKKRPSQEKTVVSARLLSQNPKAKKIRLGLNLGMLLAGVALGIASQIKHLTAKDIIFALKYGIAPISSGLQVVQMHGDYFMSNPGFHILTITGKVYNHERTTNASPHLALTVLSPNGDFIKQFPSSASQVGAIEPGDTADFKLRVELDYVGEIGSYFLAEESNQPNAPAIPATH